jgi:hypothetical protein
MGLHLNGAVKAVPLIEIAITNEIGNVELEVFRERLNTIFSQVPPRRDESRTAHCGAPTFLRRNSLNVACSLEPGIPFDTKWLARPGAGVVALWVRGQMQTYRTISGATGRNEQY